MKPGRLVVSALEGILLALLILAASYVSIGRTLVANVSGFRAEIESQLASSLNVPVGIVSIEGDWTYFDPMLRIEGLTIGSGETAGSTAAGDSADSGERAAIALDKLFARVDTFASIRARTLVVRDLVVDGVRLEVFQDAAGAWAVRGLPRRGTGIDVQPLLASVPHLMRVDVSGIDVAIVGQHRTYRLTNQVGVPFELLADGATKSLSMPLTLHQAHDASSRFELLGRYSGDPREFEFFTADLYLQLPQLELSDLLPVGASFTVSASEFSGDFWFHCVDGEFEFVARPLLESLRLMVDGEERSVLDGASALFSARGNSLRNMQVEVDHLELARGKQVVRVEAMGLSIGEADEGLEFGVSLPELDVASTASLLVSVGADVGLLAAPAIDAARELSPAGKLSQLLGTLRVLPELPNQFRIAGKLGELTLDSHRGSPSIQEVSGFFSMTEKGGFVDVLDSGFILTLPTTFEAPWPFDEASARVEVDLTGPFPVITSGLMELRDGPVRGRGRLHINLAPDRVDRTWALELGIRDGELLSASRYLPNTLSDDLRRWLDDAIVGGTVSEAGLLFHGTLDKSAPRPSKVFDMYFDVSGGELVYAPEWPMLEELATLLYIGNWGVSAEDARARTWGALLSSATVNVKLELDVPPAAVFVTGRVNGDTSDAIRFLNETPLAAVTDNMAAGWTGEGPVGGTLALTVPLGPDAAPVAVDLALSLENSQIRMAPFDLDVGDLSGEILYESTTGLSADRLEAVLFGYPVTGSISTDAGESGGAVAVQVSGQVDIASLLAWSGQPILGRAAGSADYQAHLHVPFGDRSGELAWVETSSMLEGVSLDLPRPLGKAAPVPESLVYRQSFLTEGQRIDLTLGDNMRGSLKMLDGRLAGGRFHFGASPMGAVTFDALKVTGDLPFANYDEWIALTSFLEQRSDASLETELANALESIDLDIDVLEGFGMSLEAVATYISRGENSWNVGLTNDLLSGLIRVPDNDAPLGVALEYLNIEPEVVPDGADGAVPDPLGDIDPAGLSAIDFQLDELNIGDENYGAWEFRFVPLPDGGQLLDLAAEVKGLSVVEGGQVAWKPGAGFSQFDGRILVPDLASALRQWGFASSIEGESLVLDASVKWPGSPAMIDMDVMSGVVHLREGQGRFVQAESGAGALRLLGIFDFASLARRFRFDFSDVVNKGFSFSEITGTARLDAGRISVIDPFVIVGSGSTFKVGGTVDLNTSELDNDMIVTLPLGRNLPWYAAYSAIATGPIVGAGVWLAQKVFENQINQMSSAKYRISGTIDQPVIEFVSIFNDSVREQAQEPESIPAPVGEGETGR